MKAPKRSTGSALVRDCLALLRAKGILAWRTNNTPIYDPRAGRYRAFSGMKGVADILGCLKGGKLLAIEAKEGKGRLSPEQKLFIEAVNRLGGKAVCVHSVSELIDALEEKGPADA